MKEQKQINPDYYKSENIEVIDFIEAYNLNFKYFPDLHIFIFSLFTKILFQLSKSCFITHLALPHFPFGCLVYFCNSTSKKGSFLLVECTLMLS